MPHWERFVSAAERCETAQDSHPLFCADSQTRSLREQLSNQHSICKAAVEDALPVCGAYACTSLSCGPVSAAACAASAGSVVPAPLSRAEALSQPRLGQVRADTLQLAVETWRLHPYFDSALWTQACDVLHELLVQLGAPKAVSTPDALVSFPELLQSASPDDFGKEFAAQSPAAV